MANEITQLTDKNPIINPVAGNSLAKGQNNIAQTLGSIAERSFAKATDYANEASKANLLQTHGMLQDVESQSKLEILKSPGHAEAIAKNAEQTIAKIKSLASLNKADKLNLDSMAQGAMRGLNFSAAQTAITLGRSQAKYAALSSLGDTLQSIRTDLANNPEKADILIHAQYEAIAGQVRAGIITAVEGANIHKQFTKELEFQHELLEGMHAGILTASDLSAAHATEPGQIPLSNAHLPMNQDTAMIADHHFGHLTSADIESRIANGERVSPRDLIAIKSVAELDKVMNYGVGAARATGDINSGRSWTELQSKLAELKKKEKLSASETGYKNRLNNFFVNAEQPGAYQNWIAGTPEGARIHNDYVQRQAVIDASTPFGTEQEVATQKGIQSIENLNDSITKSAMVGIGMNYPDHLRQPIPLPMITPIQNGFNKDGNINAAINNIQVLNAKNRMYAMNAFPENPRKRLTVYEIGNLTNKADQGFLETLMASQQVDALGEKPGKKDSQEKFLQLATDKEGFSDKKLSGRLSAELTTINGYLSRQPNGGALASAKIDQAMRYIKKVASDHNDFKFEHIDDYIKTYKDNMERAYEVSTGFNYVMDSVNVPLDDSEKSVLASHAISVVRDKLLEYRTPAEVDHIFTTTPPILVSSPGGRIKVKFPNNLVVPDKYGQPAYSEIYTNSLWEKAKSDTEAFKKLYKPEVKPRNFWNYRSGGL